MNQRHEPAAEHGTAPRSEGRRSRDPPPTDSRSRAAPEIGQHLEDSPLAVAILDGESLSLRYANPAFHRLGGLKGLPGAQGEEAPLLSALREVQQTGVPRCDVLLGHTVDGKQAAVRMTVWTVVTTNELVLQLRDATHELRERRERAALTEELRMVNERLLLATLREENLREEAQAAGEAKSAFLATVSHELRTPIAAIIGFEELLADGITGPVTEEQREQLARIKSSAGHLLALVDEVLSYSVREAARESQQRQPMDAADLVRAAASVISPFAESKGLTFTTQLPERPLRVQTDPQRVRRILINLLANAVKFTSFGSIELTVSSDDDRAVAFSVRDTGIGIDPAHLERIFDPFWQIIQKPSRAAGGLGLGLSVARRLARSLGGDVTVTSRAGRGSTFTLALPAAEG